MKPKPKKKGPQDATRRNVQATNKRLALHARLIRRLMTRVRVLEKPPNLEVEATDKNRPQDWTP